MDKIVNLKILYNPYNWAIVWVMLAIALLALTYLQPSVSQD